MPTTQNIHKFAVRPRYKQPTTNNTRLAHIWIAWITSFEFAAVHVICPFIENIYNYIDYTICAQMVIFLHLYTLYSSGNQICRGDYTHTHTLVCLCVYLPVKYIHSIGETIMAIRLRKKNELISSYRLEDRVRHPIFFCCYDQIHLRIIFRTKRCGFCHIHIFAQWSVRF